MFIFNFLKPKELPKLPKEPTDEVIPLHYGDDTEVLRSVCLVISYRYDDVLDPEKLRFNLERLIDREGWRKIGARLRLNDKGRLEYHVPEAFTEKRPAVLYSHESFDMNIDDHPLASKMPRATHQPAVLGDPDSFLDLMRDKDDPKELRDYISRDIPQMALHIVSFKDSTIVSLSLPHTLSDGTGGGHLYHAWSLALQGRDDEIPPFHGYDSDPLAHFGIASKETYIYADKLVTGWSSFWFKVRQVYQMMRYGSESRVVCIPRDYLANLRKTAIEEIRAETGNDKAFVSDNDVIGAWFTKLAISDLPENSNKTIRIMNAFRLVSVLGDDLLPDAKAFIANAATEMYAFLPAKEFFTKPLSHAAWAIRRSMMEGGTRDQVEALQAIKRRLQDDKGEPAIFGDSSMEMISFSNWSKGKFFETDFSPALIKEGRSSAQRAEKPGFPSYIQFNAWSSAFQLRNIFPIMGKDAAGNYWMEGPMRQGIWDLIDKKLKSGDY